MQQQVGEAAAGSPYLVMTMQGKGGGYYKHVPLNLNWLKVADRTSERAPLLPAWYFPARFAVRNT